VVKSLHYTAVRVTCQVKEKRLDTGGAFFPAPPHANTASIVDHTVPLDQGGFQGHATYRLHTHPCPVATSCRLQQTGDIASRCRAMQAIHVAEVPTEVWNCSGVLCELGAHPGHTVSTSGFRNRVDAALDESVLVGFSTDHEQATKDNVVHGIIRPASVLILSRLCLAPIVAMQELGFASTCPLHSFRDVIRRHLECLGPRAGVWESVREIPGLAPTVPHLVECKAWGTAPWTCEMSGWLERRSLEELSSDGCWWLVMRALKVKVHVELDSVLRLAAEYGCLRIVKRL